MEGLAGNTRGARQSLKPSAPLGATRTPPESPKRGPRPSHYEEMLLLAQHGNSSLWDAPYAPVPSVPSTPQYFFAQ